MGTVETKGRKWTPSKVEIRATLNRKRVCARIHFLDGQFQAVEVNYYKFLKINKKILFQKLNKFISL